MLLFLGHVVFAEVMKYEATKNQEMRGLAVMLWSLDVTLQVVESLWRDLQEGMRHSCPVCKSHGYSVLKMN